MEAVRQSWFHRFVLAALLVAIAVFLAYPWNWNAAQEFRGVLRYPVLAPGGETTGVVIWTLDGGYELDLKRNREWENQLPRLRGKPVIVLGKLTVGRSIEGRRRRIIRVLELKPDESPTSGPS